MKKFLAIVCTAGMVLTLGGCSFGEKPDVVVSTFCEALKTYDMQAAAACVTTEETVLPEMEMEDEISQLLMDYMKKKAAEMTYTIEEYTVEKGEASVPVTFTYADASEVLTETFTDYLTRGLELAFSGADDDEIEALFADVFAEKCDTVETSTATATVTFLCQKTDGEWKIYDVAEEDATALLMVMTSNLSSAMEELDASFSY